MHKRAKTNKAILAKYVIDKSDTEYNSEVIKHFNIFQNSIDDKNKRDSQEEDQRWTNTKIAERKEQDIIEEKNNKERQEELQRMSNIKAAKEKYMNNYDSAFE
eukprot:16215937-Heterocapsa_arctica.AAC.1